MMKTHLQSLGIGLLFWLFLSACQTQSRPNTYRDPEAPPPLVEEKYSLKQDREKIEALRGEVNESIKAENDQWALILKDMSIGSKSPSEVRDRFYSLVRKQKEKFNKDLTKERETFTSSERKARQSFLKNLDDKRKSFLSEKPAREVRQAFMSSIDTERSEFTSVERDRRADFEADIRDRRKNFEDYIKERTSTFDQELKAYRSRLKETPATK